MLPVAAAAQAAGHLNTEHITILRQFFHTLPRAIDISIRAHAETHLVTLATTGMTPDSLRTAADRIAAHLDPDGALPDHHDRARRRYLHLGPQHADGMSDIRGPLDPRARATPDAVFAKLAAPHATSTTPRRQRHDGNPQNTGNTSEQRNTPGHNPKHPGRQRLTVGIGHGCRT